MKSSDGRLLVLGLTRCRHKLLIRRMPTKQKRGSRWGGLENQCIPTGEQTGRGGDWQPGLKCPWRLARGSQVYNCKFAPKTCNAFTRHTRSKGKTRTNLWLCSMCNYCLRRRTRIKCDRRPTELLHNLNVWQHRVSYVLHSSLLIGISWCLCNFL